MDNFVSKFASIEYSDLCPLVEYMPNNCPVENNTIVVIQTNSKLKNDKVN